MAAKKLHEPSLTSCPFCKQTGICPRCKGDGVIQQKMPKGLISYENVTFSCPSCGSGDEIGLNGNVYPAYKKEIGKKTCRGCNGHGWMPESPALAPVGAKPGK